MAVLAESMGMIVIYYNLGDDVIRVGNAEAKTSMEEVLREADIISMHVDGRPKNRNLISEDQFKMMREGAIFLNLSRGFVVDPDALADSLISGHLRGAAVDVFPDEPSANGQPFTSPLKGLPNVILTPHIGGNTVEAQRNIAIFVSGKLIDYYEMGISRGSVNFPNVNLVPGKGTHRFVHLHRNEPGVIAGITSILADNGINITAQTLQTDGNVGYAIFDLDHPLEKPVIRELVSVPHIRTRVLY